jgi:hypothetical protein
MVSRGYLKIFLVCVLVAIHTSGGNATSLQVAVKNAAKLLPKDALKTLQENGFNRDKQRNYIFERKNRTLAEGFIYLNASYNKKVPPDSTVVTVWMEPGFIFEIDSQARQVKMEMQIKLMWEDNRVVWPRWEQVGCGQKLFFNVSFLE